MAETLHADEWTIILDNIGGKDSLAYQESLDIISEINHDFHQLVQGMRSKEYRNKLEMYKKITINTELPYSRLFSSFSDWDTLQRCLHLYGTRYYETAIISFCIIFLLFWRIIESFPDIYLSQNYFNILLVSSVIAISFIGVSLLLDKRIIDFNQKYFIPNSVFKKILSVILIFTLLCSFLYWDSFIVQNICNIRKGDIFRNLLIFYLFNIGIPVFIFSKESNNLNNIISVIHHFSTSSFLFFYYKENSIEHPLSFNFFLFFVLLVYVTHLDQMKTNEGRPAIAIYFGFVLMYFFYFFLLFLISALIFLLPTLNNLKHDNLDFIHYKLANANIISTIATHMVLISTLSRRFTLFFDYEYEDGELLKSKRYLIFYNKEDKERKLILKSIKYVDYLRNGYSFPSRLNPTIEDIEENKEQTEIERKVDFIFPAMIVKRNVTLMDRYFLCLHQYSYGGFVDVFHQYYGFSSILYQNGFYFKLWGDIEKQKDIIQPKIEKKLNHNTSDFSIQNLELCCSFVTRKSLALLVLFLLIQSIYILS